MTDVQLSTKTLDELEDHYESEMAPILNLREPIAVESLLHGGAEMEIDEDCLKREPRTEADKSAKNVHAYRNTTACGFADDDDEDAADLTPFDALRRKMTKLTDDGGVMKQQLQQGTGTVVCRGYVVFCHYSMFLEYADEPFDCSRLRDQKQKVVLSKDGDESCDVIPGLDIALVSMRKAEVSRFLIGPEYAFGKMGIPPRVPAEATIMVEVELLHFAATGSADAYLAMSVSERREAPFDVCRQAVEAKRQRGEDLFKQRRYEIAAKEYARAIQLLEEARLADEEDERKQQKDLLRNLINCALCYSRLGQHKRVISLTGQASQMDPRNAKPHYLRGKALSGLGELDRARESLLKARNLHPSDSNISRELTALDEKYRRCKATEKLLCERMFGGKGTNSTTTKGKATDGTKPSESPSNTQASTEIDAEFENVVRDSLAVLLEEQAEGPAPEGDEPVDAPPRELSFPKSRMTGTPSEGQEPVDAPPRELSFPKSRMTGAELSCVTRVARELGLEVEERGTGQDFFVKVKRPENKQD